MRNLAFTLLTFGLGVGTFALSILLSALIVRPLREAIPYSAQATAIIMVACAFLGSVLALKLIQTSNKHTYKVTFTVGIIFAV